MSIKISELPSATSVNTTDIVPIVQNGTTKKAQISQISSGGGGGTTDYTDLDNKPQINSTTLSGNKTSSDLGLMELKPTTSPIRIWDLNEGVYNVASGSTIYYAGASDTSRSNTTTSDGILFVFPNTITSNSYKTWVLLSGWGTNSKINWGGTDSTSVGATWKELNSGNNYLTTISSYVKDQLDYSTSGTTYALSAYQGYVLNQNKQDKFATTLTEDLYLVTGTAPTLTDGYYYTGSHHIYLNNNLQTTFDNCIFLFTDGQDAATFVKVVSSANNNTTQALAYMKNINNYVVIEQALEKQTNKVTSISSSSTDAQYPSAKAVYDALPHITYSTTDLTDGVSVLEDGALYFVYE